ncbi:MAG: ATP-binding protein [Bacteroidales bacterium]|jgi:MinD superfamily P-loop ATPase|nr:ATP-binding protein [Bacteroidales bacterium]
MTEKKPLKIAIASGKGGTGKTLVAVNLASLLSQTREILLVDLDVEEPNDAIFIDGTEGQVYEKQRLIPKWDESRCIICDICSDACKYHAVVRLGDIIAVFDKMCHSCHACSELCPQQALPMTEHRIGEVRQISSGNLTLIEGRLDTGEEQAVPLINQTHAMIGNYTPSPSVQIYDCPPGTACPMVAAVKRCEYVIMVTEPTPFGLNDLRLAVTTVRELGIPAGVIINRHGIGNEEVEEWCEKEGLPVLAKIPYDRRIAVISSGGETIHDKIDYMPQLLQGVMDKVLLMTSRA